MVQRFSLLEELKGMKARNDELRIVVGLQNAEPVMGKLQRVFDDVIVVGSEAKPHFIAFAHVLWFHEQ